MPMAKHNFKKGVKVRAKNHFAQEFGLKKAGLNVNKKVYIVTGGNYRNLGKGCEKTLMLNLDNSEVQFPADHWEVIPDD
jgi:hypothetical protein